MTLPDVQNYRSPHLYKLTRVGVTGVSKPLRISRGGEPHHLVGTFDVFVDLPAHQRGIHMSRNVEAINRTIDAVVREPAVGLEDLALRIVEVLLERHDYAKEAEVSVEADYFREQRTPENDAPTLERYDLSATAHASRKDDGTVEYRKAVAITATGMSACPCAMEGSRARFAEQGVDVGNIPTITHNQRNHCTVLVETTREHQVEADDLIDVAEESLSAPTYELLKRGDETALVMQAHMHPRFVEDVVREALHLIEKRYGHLPDDTLVMVRSEAEESIHKHNAFAERATTMADLKRPASTPE